MNDSRHRALRKRDTFIVSITRGKPPGHDPNASDLPYSAAFSVGGWAGEVFHDRCAMLTVSADGQRFVIVVGAIYRPRAADIGATLLALYEQRGIDFVRDLNGSFTLLLVDQSSGDVWFVTDRLNTVKLLVSESDGAIIVSNSMEVHPVSAGRIDAAAVACYLASGFVYNNRTVYESIHVLDGGSLYRLRGGKLEQRRYWQYQPSDAPASTVSPTLRADLRDAMIDAVRVRLPENRPVYLSLSAGYDSRTILGILADDLHVPDVRAFSYAYGTPRPMSDEALAGQLAHLRGYSHQVIQGFSGNVLDTLRVSGQLGGGMAEPCDEVDAWLGFAADAGAYPVLFVGDTVMPHHELRLASVEDALLAARMVDFSALRWLEPLAERGWYQTCVEATRAERERAVGLADAHKHSLYGLYDILRLVNRDSRSIFTWRETFAGRVFEVASPFLDEPITELTMNAPVAVRQGKRFFIDTVTALYPDLFALPLATSASYASYWPDALRRQANDLRHWIETTPSPLDEVLDPRLLLALLGHDLSAYGRRNAAAQTALKVGYHLLRQAGVQSSALRPPARIRPVTSAQQFLKRALVLRCFLHWRSDPASARLAAK